jgi:hypothetical protein
MLSRFQHVKNKLKLSVILYLCLDLSRTKILMLWKKGVHFGLVLCDL